jgi:hypothetical protein
MNYQDNVFVSNTMYTNYNSRTLAIDANTGAQNVIDSVKYFNNKKEENEYIYYKVINLNFKFQKVFKIKLNFVSLHIGDIIDYITKKTGIKKLIIKLTNGNCGCEARRVKFNKWFKIPILLFKFDKLSYKNKIDIESQEKTEQDIIDKQDAKRKEEEIIENVKLNMINKKFEKDVEYNNIHAMNPESSSTNKKPGGCGCGAKKPLSKRVKYA